MAYQEQLEPVIRQRAEARAQEQGLTDRGLNMTEAELGELHRLRNEINKHSAQLGDYAAESYVQSKFSDAEQVTRLYGGADQPNRAGDFDQVWCVTLKTGEVHLVIIEAKGGSSPLGSRMTRAGRAQQGTPEYMNEIIEIMRGNRNNTAVMDAVDSALRDRTLTYMEVRAPVRSGTGGDESVGIEASDFILRPGQP